MYVVKVPSTGTKNNFYISNRAPLLPSPFIKLPIGSITPKGWLRHQLELMAEGMTGNLTELSDFCKFEGNAWVSPTGEGNHPWEEVPYWLKGFGDLGYVLKDKRIIDEARRWIEGVLSSQQDDGWFGPKVNKASLKTPEGMKPDLWPNMIMLNVLQSFYEATGDARVLPFMAKYFKWEMNVPDVNFLPPLWQKIRAGDNLESVYWLYNRTGESWLLDVAEKIHSHTADWTSGIPTWWHGVNITQGFREPAIYYMQNGNPIFLEAASRNYNTVKGSVYGQVPGGLFSADENAREGFSDPRQAAETCSMVEFMHSAEMLLKIAGDPVWVDRCEDVAFNSLPASQTPELKGLHYLTAPNMVQIDRGSKCPAFNESGPMLAWYADMTGEPYLYRCCQHNVSHGWPYYAEELWLATPDNGLCASLYADCEVNAKVGDGSEVKITENTDYPFDETVNLTVSCIGPVRFPVYLRVPGWCEGYKVTINGNPVKVEAKPLSYVVLDRTWSNGDKVNIQLPMRVTLTVWKENKNSVSVNRGPLTYSLKIGERWEKFGGTDKWPAYEVYPTTPWNYGLVINEKDPADSFEVVKTSGQLAYQPFNIDTAPVKIHAKGKKIPDWKMHIGLVGLLRMSPIRSNEPLEDITLNPMGCTRLRISAFPVIGEGEDAYDWFGGTVLPETYVLSSNSLKAYESAIALALNDGRFPDNNSADLTIPRMTWNNRGTKEWFIYEFSKERELNFSRVYWCDDEATGGNCRIPAEWRLLYKRGDVWYPVEKPSAYGTELNKFNEVSFKPIKTTEIQLEVQLEPGFTGGVFEWEIGRK